MSKTMPLNPLGKGGPMVSKFALGTMTFGNETDEDEAFRQLDLFVDHGGTFIDTADVYSGGVSETIIGKWVRQRGHTDDLIMATKGRFAPPAGSFGASRRSLVKSANASLKRLQIDAIDVYYVHGWDKDTPILETLSTLDDLVRAGKIHNIAWSNVSGWQLQNIISTATAAGFAIPVAVQPQYNLLERGIELEVLPCCLENHIAITPWSPLGGGWLTGKYTAQTRPQGATRLGEDPNRGVEAYDTRSTDRTYAILAALQTIADQHNRPLAHVALSWLSARPGVASLLLGARTADQLNDNIAAVDLVLDQADHDALTSISAGPPKPYPYDFLEGWSGLTVWKELGL